MKQTEIGLIPDDWEVNYINNLASITTGNKNTQDKVDNGMYPFFVRSQEVERINEYGYDCEGVITAGDGVGTGKIFHYINGKFALHQRCYLMYNFKNIDAHFFYWIFSNKFYERVSAMTAKSSVDSVRKEMISEMLISYPKSIKEQQRIAKALSDVDALISTTEKLIQKKKNIKQGAMQNLLTGKKRLPGFGPQTKSPAYKQTELGSIPGDWEIKSIKDFAKVYDGTHQTPHYVDVGIPFYSVENVTANDFEHTKLVSEREHRFLTSKVKIEKGDILMTRIGSIGDCKYIDWEPEASFYVSLALIKCDTSVDARFISYYSNSLQFKKELELRSLITAIPQKINLGPISEIILVLPPKKEQTSIADVLSSMDKEIETLNTKLEKYRNLKTAMMQQLLTAPAYPKLRLF